MENERHRYQVSSVVQQVDDGVSERDSEQTVPHCEAIVKYTNRNAADSEQKISVLFGDVVVVVKKAAITEYNWVSYGQRMGKFVKNQ